VTGWARRWSLLWDTWRTQLWPLPTAGVAAAVGLGVGLPRLDAHLADNLPAGVTAYLFTGGPEAARTVLSTIASSLITVTSLTFSLTVVTLQLASTQFSPRLLRTFTRDRIVQVTLALLLATFTYAVTVLRTVRASLESQAAFVPQLSVTVAYLLGLISVLALVGFLAHLAQQIRVESMLRQVHSDTTATLRREVPDGSDARPETPPIPPADAATVRACSSGFLTWADDQALVAAAVGADVVILLHRLPGDFLVAGTPIAVVWSRATGTSVAEDALADLAAEVAGAVRVGFERTTAQDVAFGLRQLVDVATKALSPGINDPTTAVHALGHASALLCEATTRDLGPRLLRDDSGQARVIMHRPDFGALLDLVVGQPRRYGAADPEVLARLFTLLREVAWSTRQPEHRRVIAEQLDRLRRTVDGEHFDGPDRQQLDAGARAVDEALAGQWSPPRPPDR
jgi:uncharacterized membrane protein